MPTMRRGDAFRQHREALRHRREDERNTLSEEEESFAERGHAGEAASGGSRSTVQSAPQITPDFLSTLIETITRAQVEANRSLINSLMSSNGELRVSSRVGSSTTINVPSGSPAAPAMFCTEANFTKCTARFNGSSQDTEVLEAFLDAVEVYKECAGVSDEHALRGLPMLLEGEAAVWWRGVKASAATWSDAISRLRATYGVAQPAHLTLRQIFSREQDEERAESFLCRVRALIAKLPYTLAETVQIDICYGLLHRRIVKRVPRDSVRSLDELFYKARIAEDTYKELKVNFAVNIDENSAPQIITAVTTTDRYLTQSLSSATSTSTSRSNHRNSLRCNYCKKFGHVSEECRHREKKSTNKGSNFSTSRGVRSSGCGKQERVVRSKCNICAKPVCSGSQQLNKLLRNGLIKEFVT